MKRILPFVALVSLLAASCSNIQDPNPSFKSRGMITGPDFRRAAYPCGGGFYIEIEGTTYRFFQHELPANSDIRLSETNFPIPVKLSWSKNVSGGTCTQDVIIIHAIAKE